MTSSTIIAAVIGRMRFSPAAPSGIKTVSAASGPYDAELSASRPKIGIARAGPTLSWNSSLFASGRPRIKSRSAIQWTFTDSFVRDRVRQRLIGGRRVNAVATKKAGRRALWPANRAWLLGGFFAGLRLVLLLVGLSRHGGLLLTLRSGLLGLTGLFGLAGSASGFLLLNWNLTAATGSLRNIECDFEDSVVERGHCVFAVYSVR